jgi:hypothetical protein
MVLLLDTENDGTAAFQYFGNYEYSPLEMA